MTLHKCPHCDKILSYHREAFNGPYCTCPKPQTMTTNTTQPTGATFASTQQMAEEVRQAAQNRTPDPIQAAVNELESLLNRRGCITENSDMLVIATAMRELVAREQLKDILAVAAMREELAELTCYVQALEEQCDSVGLQQAQNAAKYTKHHPETDFGIIQENAKLREKVKNQADRIRVLEGPINHAGGLNDSKMKAESTRLRERVAELEKLHDGMAESFHDSAQSMSRQLSAAKVDLAAARRDAERYQWLKRRGLCWRGCNEADTNWIVGPGTEWIYDRNGADATIDAAMQREDGK